MSSRAVLAFVLGACAVGSSRSAAAEMRTDPSPVPQMRLALYVQESPAHGSFLPTDMRLSLPALRADGPPREAQARTRFVVELQGPPGPGRAVQTCVAAVFEPAPPGPPHPLLTLEDETERLEWLEGTFRFPRVNPWLEARFEGPGPVVFHLLNPSSYGIQDGGTYRVAVRFSSGYAPEVERVLQGTAVLYDASVCPLHRERMGRVPIPIAWGLGDPTDWNLWPSAGPERPPDKVRAAFPHYFERLNGGCVTYSDRPTINRYLCPACARAFQAWKDRSRQS